VCLLLVGSGGGAGGPPGPPAYAVSKAGVVALARVLALENKQTGIRVNCVLPGTIDTAANRSAMPKADKAAWTAPAAIARVIVFLLSDASAPVTGAVVPVDAHA
jgi:NAD(P)-dependent dehydrogenase (short-subunit alcohol dehydrogenase family)